MNQTSEIRRRGAMGLSPVPQHSFPVPKVLFESDRSSTPGASRHTRGLVTHLCPRETIHSCSTLNSPKAMTPARGWADSCSLCTVGCFCWAPPEGSAWYNIPKQRFDPKIPHLDTVIGQQTLWLDLHKSQFFLKYAHFSRGVTGFIPHSPGENDCLLLFRGQSTVSNGLQLLMN